MHLLVTLPIVIPPCPTNCEGTEYRRAPTVIQPPEGMNWKDYGGKFAEVSEEMQRVFEEAAKRPRND
jgi:hypothetical protein